jgi:hypothetical protein
VASAAALATWLVGVAPEPATLRWEAPATCPSASDVAARLAARVGDGHDDADPTRGEALVAREGARYIATLVVTTDAGTTTRRLEADACNTVADAAVLIVAMVHAERTAPTLPEPPAAATPEPAAPTPPPATSPTPPTTPRTDPPAAAPRADTTPRTRAAILAEASLGMGGLPRVGLGLGGGVAVLRPPWRGELVGRYWTTREAAIGPAQDDARVAVAAGTIGAHAGPVWRLGPVELVAMAGVHAGVAVGRGRGVAVTRVSRRPWLAAGLHLALLWPLQPRVALGLRGALEGIVVRPRFEVREGGRRYTVAPVAGALAAAIEIRLGPAGKKR